MDNDLRLKQIQLPYAMRNILQSFEAKKRRHLCLFLERTKINENKPNSVPKINKGVFVFWFRNFIERSIRGLRRASEFFVD